LSVSGLLLKTFPVHFLIAFFGHFITAIYNPYYKGIVKYNGVEHQGRHTPLIDEATWDRVQEVLKSKFNGERTRIHEHYLKSTVFCGKCGARL